MEILENTFLFPITEDRATPQYYERGISIGLYLQFHRISGQLTFELGRTI